MTGESSYVLRLIPIVYCGVSNLLVASVFFVFLYSVFPSLSSFSLYIYNISTLYLQVTITYK